MAASQTYANHRYRPVAWSVFAVIGVMAVTHAAIAAWQEPNGHTYIALLTAITATGAVFLLRTFALRLQNRIIRLEMDVRLRRLGRAEVLARLTVPQLVALRFASDAEMPLLVDRALAENLTGDQIKRAVTDWQGDHLRT